MNLLQSCIDIKSETTTWTNLLNAGSICLHIKCLHETDKKIFPYDQAKLFLVIMDIIYAPLQLLIISHASCCGYNHEATISQISVALLSHLGEIELLEVLDIPYI